MSYRDWYTINENKDGSYMCVAVDKEFNFTKQYRIDTVPGSTTLGNCECVAGHTWCRHKKILVKFRARPELIGSRTYYNFDRDKWMKQEQQEL